MFIESGFWEESRFHLALEYSCQEIAMRKSNLAPFQRKPSSPASCSDTLVELGSLAERSPLSGFLPMVAKWPFDQS